MTYAVDIEREVRYILEDDRKLPDGAPNKPVFFIRGLSIEEAAEVDDSIAESIDERGSGERKRKRRERQQRMQWKLGTSILKILDYGLLRFENMRTKDGREIVWDESQRRRLYSYIPEAARGEIADAIRNITDLTEDEIKNYGSEQPS